MLKSLSTLWRGKLREVDDDLQDRNAHQLLRQYLVDATNEVETARKVLALSMAQNRQEAAQHEKLLARMADLETRTLAALEAGNSELARDAAEAIALMEAERDASDEAQARYTKEVDRLKARVRQAEAKLRELNRGQRVAAATHSAQKLQSEFGEGRSNALRDAEDTLKRLQARQQKIDLADSAMEEMSADQNPDAIVKRLADAGCGEAQSTSADAVLDRLKVKMKSEQAHRLKQAS
ncbi:MAG: PspA/IM30 family protein [Pseudomonadota bacterium]